MTRRVLVTRPQPGADETAQRLVEHGFAPILLPLTRIVALAPGDLGDLSRFDAVTLTSVNAVRHTPPELIAALRNKPAFAVGDVSAKAARAAGFATVHAAAGTAADLAPLMASKLAPGSRVLHLAAVERTAGFIEDLAARGIVLEVIEIYRADRLDYAGEALKAAFGDEPVWGAMSLSERAAIFLADIAQKPETAPLFETTRFFCISQKVARPLRKLASQVLVVDDTPTEDAVMRLLLSHD